VSEGGFLVLFFLFLLVAVGVGVLAYQAKLRRQKELGTVARNQGLDFSILDPFDTLAEPFSLLNRGDGRGVENVMWGFWHDLEIRAFDYWYYEESTDSNGHRSKSYRRFDCVLAPVEARFPRLEITNENVLTRIADALTFRDIEFESEEFNRHFNVKADDRRFASAFCDARLMEWLLQHGDGYAFEVVGDRLLCWCRRVKPAGIVHLLGTASSFREQIPDVVRSLYPNG
jgi:hypothetical protein